MKAIAKFNTAPILKTITKKGYKSINAFATEYEKRFKKSTRAVTDNLKGINAPTEPAFYKNIAEMLGIKEKDVKACYENPKEPETPKPENKDTKKVFVYERLEDCIQKSGMSKNKICRILGIGDSTLSNWKVHKHPTMKTLKRVCELLDAEIDTLFEEVEIKKEKPVEEVVKNTITAEKTETAMPVITDGYKTIEPTHNLYERMEIINNNILLLASQLQNMKTLPAIEPAKEITIEETKEKQPAEKEEAKPAKPVAKKTDHEAKCKEMLEKKINDVDTDTLSQESFIGKINDMVALIAKAKDSTFNNMMHHYYKELTNVYGVVYDQLKKEYVAVHGGSPKSTMEMVYQNKDIRKIMYNIIATDLSHIKN